MKSFVATRAPQGWKLGRWSQIDQMTWQETKLDNPKESYLFAAVAGGVNTSAIRLHLQGTATEVLLLDSSIQIFVDGRYFGEYIGHWDGAGPNAASRGGAGLSQPPSVTLAQAPTATFAHPPTATFAQPPTATFAQPPAATMQPAPATLGGPPALPARNSFSQQSDGGGLKAAPPPAGSPQGFAGYVDPAATQLPATPAPPIPGGGPAATFGAGASLKSAPPPPGGGGMKAVPTPAAGFAGPPPHAGVPAPAPGNMPGRDVPSVSPPSRPQKAANLDNSAAMVGKLHKAAKDGDLAEVQRLLGNNVDPDGASPDGTTAMYVAADKGHMNVIEALLAAGADPNVGKGDKTPMVAAFQKGNKEILSMLFASAFHSLQSSVGGGLPTAQSRGPVYGDDDEAPPSAHDELREVTVKLAHLSKTKLSPDWTDNALPEAPAEMTDSDAMREEAVRVAMRSLVEASKDEMAKTGASPSPRE